MVRWKQSFPSTNRKGPIQIEENTKRMLAGQLYSPPTAELQALITRGHHLSHDYNLTYEEDVTRRAAILDQLLGHHGTDPYLQGPIHFDYGRFTSVGDHFYANFNLTVLDTCPVTIGDNVMCGPNVSLITAEHPLTVAERNPKFVDGQPVSCEFGRPITIEDNCWLGSNVTVLGGVTIGAGSVIGAGTVVTKDVPAKSLVVGQPGRALRTITAADRQPGFAAWARQAGFPLD